MDSSPPAGFFIAVKKAGFIYSIIRQDIFSEFLVNSVCNSSNPCYIMSVVKKKNQPKFPPPPSTRGKNDVI